MFRVGSASSDVSKRGSTCSRLLWPPCHFCQYFCRQQDTLDSTIEQDMFQPIGTPRPTFMSSVRRGHWSKWAFCWRPLELYSFRVSTNVVLRIRVVFCFDVVF
ncbi:hypothetical protein NPIL_133191 [Nephila pilipes]|uniref:Uncharacterized protein n=1 Tax=Nephila pilipes TaxID=299642 RepID=A0A8X6PRC6_NEPPI|nr:hypothetical protein NPIL_133191 [Nephila pilipes]